MSATLRTGNPATPEELRARVLALHEDVHDALQSQFGATLTDLVQLRALLGDAAGKLSVAFHAMMHEAREQRAAARRLEIETGAPAATEVRELAEEIGRAATQVVQSLQFEDMATQLLAHVDRRLAWLEQFARTAAPLQTAITNDTVGLTIAQYLAVEHDLVASQRALAEWDRKSVRQESLDAGDIELF